MTQPQPKKTSGKTTKTRRLLSKLPTSLPAYNYEDFSYKDMRRAVTYYQAELSKLEKLLSKFPTIANQQETKSSQPINSYMDIYGGQPNVSQYGGTQPYNNQVKPSTSKPEVVAPPLPYQPYTSGLQGDHMEMPSILGSSGVVVNTLREDYQGSPTTFNSIVETTKLPIVKDNSAELIAELKNLINPTN